MSAPCILVDGKLIKLYYLPIHLIRHLHVLPQFRGLDCDVHEAGLLWRLDDPDHLLPDLVLCIQFPQLIHRGLGCWVPLVEELHPLK